MPDSLLIGRINSEVGQQIRSWENDISIFQMILHVLRGFCELVYEEAIGGDLVFGSGGKIFNFGGYRSIKCAFKPLCCRLVQINYPYNIATLEIYTRHRKLYEQ